ncbi:hypothetical protein ACQ86B_22450 [Mycolicibacterium aichiense]|uniref:hypothetical protein n=1 Tax=Mycolicibacterium aichiense TaxID=1799 RepID=UPI003D67D8E9
MYRRILTLTMLAALLTTSLFGIPLAVAAAHYYRADERIELERVADKAAIDVAADLFHGRFTGDLPATQDESTSLALYGADAARLGGRGPATADLVVQQALAGNTVHHLTLSDQFLVAVPIADGERAAYVVRASASTSEVYPRILAAWALMLTLATLILLLTWRVARGQARRLASPSNTSPLPQYGWATATSAPAADSAAFPKSIRPEPHSTTPRFASHTSSTVNVLSRPTPPTSSAQR